MNPNLIIALDAIKEVQAKRITNWDDEESAGFQERELLHLKQLDVLNRQILSIENGTYQQP